jgi:phosphatidylserine/phosphatidylglycerophosphate/cardiolipin synthase-like enzyme
MSETEIREGRNCWRVARANRAAVIVDACDYFHVARQAMLKARHRILLIGWDFDARIQLERSEDGADGDTLGAFLLKIAKRHPEIAIDILKWDVGALKQLGRGASLAMLLRWAMTRQITFKFDSKHPTGCSHHQKIVVIDDSFAVCGGIDMTGDRWDTRAHRDDDPCRRRPAGQPYGPWHDATMVVDGDAAKALAELGHDRWKVATGDDLAPIQPDNDPWPDDLEPQFRDVDIAISRTRAECGEVTEVREIEAMWLDLIASAKRFLYIENQYFTSGKLAAAIARRLKEPDPPEIVMINPIRADGWLEQKAMDGARVKLVRAIGKLDTHNRFRIYTPKTAKGDDIYVHAKVTVVDDRVFRVGSSNMNNRSMGLDSECDVTLDCSLPGNEDCAGEIAAIRSGLMAEHLGVEQDVVEQSFARTGSLIETIEALRGKGKTLAPLVLEEPDAVEEFIAESELLDPERPDEMFEGPGKRGLFRRWKREALR